MEPTAIGFHNGGHGENERPLHKVSSAHLEEYAPPVANIEIHARLGAIWIT